MADGATTSSWFPVVTLLVGYMTKSTSEWIQHRRTTERERLQHQYAAEREREARDAARRDQLFERRNSFQRQTLLDLQEALMQLARATGAMHHLDEMAYRQTGKWQKQLVPEDLSENDRLANARTAMLTVRVRDKSVRNLVQQFKDHGTHAIMSATEEESEHALMDMGTVFETLKERIGEILRQLDDEGGCSLGSST